MVYIRLLPLQGVTSERALTQGVASQGVASLALGYTLIGLSARALSAAPQQFKQTWLYSVCTIIQPVHYRRQNLHNKIKDFERSTP